MNKIRIEIKNEVNSKWGEGFIEIKVDHGSEKEPSVIISLTTVPERLRNGDPNCIRSTIESLCVQEDDDFEIHFNIPEISNITGEKYEIPEWLPELVLKYRNLKIFRTEDMGPPTKFVPTVQRLKNPDTIILVVDDDLVYHPKMVSEHRKYQYRLNPNSVICYEGRGSDILLHQGDPDDIRDCWVLCVTCVRRTFSLQHYKSVSYKKRLFDQDFFNYYLGRTLSDDALVSQYFMDKDIRMFVVPYEPDNHLFATKELWKQNHGVVTFPVVRDANTISNVGCNHPKLLEHPLGDRFYWPTTLGDRSFIGPTPLPPPPPPIVEDTIITEPII